MLRDDASWKLPPGALYDSLNLVYDKRGVARQRGGTTALVSGAQTAFATSPGFAHSEDSATIEELYGANGKTGHLHAINKTTGAATDLGAPFGATATDTTFGRPVNHFGFVGFPGRGAVPGTPEQQRSVIASGSVVSTVFTNSANATIAADQNVVTLTGGNTTTNVKVGATVTMFGTGTVYFGRVVSILSGTTFSVWPKSPHNVTATSGNLNTHPFEAFTNAACAASFQNRLLWGGPIQSTTSAAYQDRRFIYSLLPTELGDDGSGGAYGGAHFIYLAEAAYPPLNYVEIPGTDPIVALEPTSDNELLILTSTHPVVFRGNLVTYPIDQVVSPAITWDESAILSPAGCLSDLSVQRTRRGVIWAGVGGIHVYTGSSAIDDLTEGTINAYWRGLAADVSTFVIHGSAYVRGHYIVSGTSGGVTFSLACDLTSKSPKWTRLSGAGTDIFYGVARPTNPSQVFALRWWAQSGAAPSMTNGQTVRLESILAPYTVGATKTDSDGSAVPVLAQTPTIGGDTDTQKMFQRCDVRHQQSSTTAAMTVTAQSGIDAADADASRTRTLGSLSNTSTLTVSNATNANPIVITTSAAHGLQSEDFVDIDAVLGNLNANGRWRIQVVNTTSFSLIGGIGSGAYTSGGKVKKLTETGFQLSSLNKGQGASLTISGSPNNFELHGVRIAFLENKPVVPA
jgi:hypothetical protein